MKSDKSFRQIVTLIAAISRSKGSQDEIQWVRKEIQQYLIKVFTLGLGS